MAVLGKLKKIVANVLDIRIFNQFQDSVIAAVNPLLSNPLLGGHLVQNVELSNSTDNFVSHGLGAKYSGFFVTRIYNARGFSDIWESSTTNNSPEKFIILNCMDTLQVDIWVF